MTIAGLTGGIACGKTTVSRIMKDYGFAVISADDISHTITEKNRLVLSRIKKTFGKEFLNKDGSLIRENLSKIIFADKEKREMLNKIVHPQIIRSIEDEISAYKKMGVDIIIIEAALLFEIGYDQNVDIKLVVATNRNLQIKRLMKRDNCDKKEAIIRVKKGNNNFPFKFSFIIFL
jgi:dephospho-CoA kinase